MRSLFFPSKASFLLPPAALGFVPVNSLAAVLEVSMTQIRLKNKTKRTSKDVLFVLEAPPRLELGIRVLQTRALPLGHGATY